MEAAEHRAVGTDAIRVLLAEDSFSDAELILRHLRKSGFEVQAERVDIAEAFTHALRSSDWDVVLCDFTLPAFSADEALALLRQSGKDIPFVVVSGNIGEESAVELLRAGAADYISKTNLARLAPAIRRELHEVAGRRERAMADLERARLTTQLKQSQRRYKMLFESFTDMVLVLKLDGRVVEANATACELLGLEHGELVSRSFADLPGIRDDYIRSPAFLDRICQHGHAVHELVVARNGGEGLVFDAHFRVIEFEGLPTIIAVARDISLRKRMEEERARLYAELETHVAARTHDLEQSKTQLAAAKTEAERSNRAKSVFLASVSHEIRTPLNAILGFSQILLRDGSLTPPQRESIATINRSGEHLLALINDILEMSSIESGKIKLAFATLDLPMLVRDVGAMFRPRAGAKGLDLVLDLAGDIPTAVVSDEKKLRQILINLLGNAVKFTEHGSVRCHVRRQDVDSGALLRIDVEDTGPGIAAEELSKLFDKFAQTNLGLRMGGTGLGLAICREFARLLGGDIQVISVPGRGTCFSLEIPLIEGNLANLSAGPSASQAFVLKDRRNPPVIMVVDDQADSRTVLCTILESAGYATHQATGAIDALAKFDDLRPHAVMMDMRMPTMHGIEVTQQLRKRPGGKHTIVIAVTASAFDEDRQRALDGGMNGFICKPFRTGEVLETLGHHLRVEYTNADADSGVTPSPVMLPMTEWSTTLLADVPADLLHKFREAVVAAEYDALLSLLDDLDPIAPVAALEFRRLVHAFDYQTLLDKLGGETSHA